MKNRTFYLLFICLLFVNLAFCEEQAPKQKRVYVDVAADLLHAGHVEFFKQAKALGDYLIVGVLSDADVISHHKRMPILTLEERVTVVKACRYVDEVIIAPPLRVSEEWLKANQIDVVVHGNDYDRDQILDFYGVPVKMGLFQTVPYTKGISTPEIIKRVVDRFVINVPRS